MSYFDWEKEDYVAKAREIQRRGFVAEARIDYEIPCFIRGCGRKPKRRETVYKPIKSPGAQNKVIAHVECVDRTVAEADALASGRTPAPAQPLKANRFTAVPESSLGKSRPSKPFLGLTIPPETDVPSIDEILKLINESRATNSWEAGYREGYRKARLEIWESLRSQAGQTDSQAS